MTRSTRHQGPIAPRWVRGLLTGALLAVFTTNMAGCGLSYVFRNISPLHVTGKKAIGGTGVFGGGAGALGTLTVPLKPGGPVTTKSIGPV